MKYTMAKTQQFGACHFKKGEQVFIRPVKGIGNNFILSKRKHCQFGPTVSMDYLKELVIAEELPKQEVISARTVAGNAFHDFRHVGYVLVDGEWQKAYLMDHDNISRYYLRAEDGERMYFIHSARVDYDKFLSREEYEL